MTYANFKTYVAAYMNRDTTFFVRGSVNLLNEAILDAVRSAQLQYDFNQLMTVGFLSTNAYGAEISNMKTTPGGATALLVKKVKGVWQYDDTSGQYQKIRRVDMIVEPQLSAILPTLTDAVTEPQVRPVTYKNRAYVYGTKLFVTGFTDSTVFWCDVVKNLADLSADADTNIFIDKYKVWTLWKCIQQLNGLLPDTERIQVSSALLDKEWDIIVKEDSDLASADDSQNGLE